MKRKHLLFLSMTVMLLSFAACNNTSAPEVPPTAMPTETIAPTMEPTVAPVETEAPTETPVPTEEPTATMAPTATPTEAVEAPTETPVATETPTEIPHVHTWEVQTTVATCLTDGSTVEVCSCGEEQNRSSIPATGHTVVKNILTESTVDEVGTWEEVCTVCGEVTATGTIEKVLPTATPSPTATPAPTATATPVPTSTPTPTPTATPKPTATPTPSPSPTPATKEPYLAWNEYENVSSEITMDTLNTVSHYIMTLNYEETYGEVRGITRMTVSSSDESVVIAEFDVRPNPAPETDKSSSYVTFRPKGAGTAVVTFELYEKDEAGNTGKKLDTMVVPVTVKEHESHVEFKTGDYIPADHGYTVLVGEQQCGDTIYESIWKQDKEDGDAVLVLTGTGKMWNKEETMAHLGTTDRISDVCYNADSSMDVVELHVSEGITRTEYLTSTLLNTVTKLTLPSTLTEIGENSFFATHITELNIPESVTRIELGAFDRSDYLTEIIIPDKVEYIGPFAFGVTETKNSLVKELRIPASVTYVDYRAFQSRAYITIIVPKETDISTWHPDWDYGYEINVVRE